MRPPLARNEAEMHLRDEGLIMSFCPADIFYCGECDNAHVLVAPVDKERGPRRAARDFAAMVEHIAGHWAGRA